MSQAYTPWYTLEPCIFVVRSIFVLVSYGPMLFLTASKMVVSVNRRILLWSISALYFVCFTEFIIQWYTLDLEIVTNGSTRESIFISIVDGGSRWIRVFMDFLRYSCLMLSDGLLVGSPYFILLKPARFSYTSHRFGDVTTSGESLSESFWPLYSL